MRMAATKFFGWVEQIRRQRGVWLFGDRRGACLILYSCVKKKQEEFLLTISVTVHQQLRLITYRVTELLTQIIEKVIGN